MFSKKCVIGILFLLLISISNLVLASDQFTPEMVMNLNYISSPKISPDGKYIAYSKAFLAPEDEGKKYLYYELWVKNLETGNSELYATKEESSKKYKWSVDSKYLYFLSKRASYNNKQQVYKMPVDGGVAQLVTKHATGIIDFKVSKNQDKIAFIAKINKTKEQKKLQENGEDWIINEKDFTFQYLYIIDILTKETTQISPDNMHVFSFVWEPNEQYFIYQAANSGLTDYSYMFRDLYRVSTSDKKAKLLCEHDGRLGSMTVSPDGKFMAFLGAVDISDPTSGSLLITEIGSGKWNNLTKGFEGTIRDIDWLDNSSLVFGAETFNYTSIYTINRLNGEKSKIFGKGELFKSIDLANNKNTFVCTANEYNHPDELYMGDLKSKSIKRLTDSNPELNTIKFIEPEEYKWQARDDVEIQGVVIKPEKFESNGTAPLYVHVHGGPEGVRHIGWNNRYNNWPQILAQKGFVIFIPNYRGSTGRGVEFTKGDHGDMMGLDFNDVLDGIDDLIEKKWVDTKKVGIAGGSYGGYMAAWAATKYSDRFAAAVMMAGISNQISKMGMTDTPHENSLVHWNSYSWDTDFNLAWDRSPLKYFKNHKTPLLIAHGKKDKRVPTGQAYELFRALKHIDQAHVELFIYPNEKHGLRMRAHRYHYMINALEWLEKYLLADM